MTLALLPATFETMVTEDGKPTLPYLSFFENLSIGDVGNTFTPTFVNLTEVGGSAAKTGRYYQLSRKIVIFFITLTPVTSISATAGTTYCDNFPMTFTNDSINWAVTGGIGSVGGMNVASNNRIFIPAISAATNPVTIIGIGEVR